MATSQKYNPGIAVESQNISQLPNEKESHLEDDFEVLDAFDNLKDSGLSSTSTIPEKHAFENSEKILTEGGLGDSTINKQPYWEKSRFIDKQNELEKKRSYMGEGNKGNETEKTNEALSDKVHVPHIENVPVLSEENRPGNLENSCEMFKQQGILQEKGRRNDQRLLDSTSSGIKEHQETERKGTEEEGVLHERSKLQAMATSESEVGSKALENRVGENAETGINEVEQMGSSEDGHVHSITSGQTGISKDGETGFSGGEHDPSSETSPVLRSRILPTVSRPSEKEPLKETSETNENNNEGTGAIIFEQRGCCNSRTMLCVTAIGCILIGILILILPSPSPHKPIVEIYTKRHVPPSSPSLQLQGSCRGYNSNIIITQCQWKQIHPIPSSPENTILPDTAGDCLQGIRSYDHKVDATLSNLKVPKELGNYVFELRCSDYTGNAKEKRVEIWIDELIPPIIKIPNENIAMSTSVGWIRLDGSCRAAQGKVAEEGWFFIHGSKEIFPSKNGTVEIDTPGKYTLKYKCIDSYGGHDSSAKVVVTAKPPYVLGIDLGTSTTCVVVIKEDGTTQDINIYHDEDDTDSCMPSVVAFGLDGKLLIGEEALSQAVVNPASTIYEVKRLMGRSYYDDVDHTFSYRVRPTLKSHSLKGVRAAVEIPCHGATKLLPPELVSALILRRVADRAEEYLKVPVKDVIISVPAQFDDAQRKATMDAGLIAGLNPIKIVNEPTVAAFAARNVMEKWSDLSQGGNADTKKEQETVWAVVADIGGGTTDYALMQIDTRNYYKVIVTDGNKTLGGRDIDIQLAKKLTELFQKRYSNLDLQIKNFQQKLRIECENVKIQLSIKEEYSLTVQYDNGQGVKVLMEQLLTRDVFEEYISEILQGMVAPLNSLMARSDGLNRNKVEELYLVGGTSNIPKLKNMLQEYFSNVKVVRHKDPVQLVSRGAAAFGAALTHLVDVKNMPNIDVTPLPISIAVDMDVMHVVFVRNHLYPGTTHRIVTTFTDDQTTIMIKVYEGDGRTADECHFLGEFELSGIPPLPKRIPQIMTTFRIDSNGILSVKATHGDKVTGMKLDVLTKSGSMISKTRDKLSALLAQLMSHDSKNYPPKCSLLDTATKMDVIPPKPNRKNVLQLSVDSQYDSVQMVNKQNPSASIPAVGMIAVTGLVTDYGSATKSSDLDIVLVIDESGSMEGTPIATIKRVILRLVDILKVNHRLGIVSYDNSVNDLLELAYCTEENKRRAHHIVTNIRASGGTNLFGGLVRGLQMAYHGGRRSRVLLFTDGYANVGWSTADDIIRETVKEINSLKSLTTAQVQLSTFGYLEQHDEFLLQTLATNVGGGTYNYLKEDNALAKGFGHVLGDAINIVAEKIHLTVTMLSGVRIEKAVTNFTYTKNAEKMTFDIPSTADQQSRHILIKLSVPPCKENTPHDVLFHVELAYTNTITDRAEGGEEYLFVARTARLDTETRSREVDEQLNRVFVAGKIEKALEHLKDNDGKQAMEVLKEADKFVLTSISKEHTLSLCLRHDLAALTNDVEHATLGGDLNDAKKTLQDSLTSHWQERGGRHSCYLTKREDKLISVLES